MKQLSAMLWIELHKAVRSRMPLWTALGSIVMPVGVAFLIFVSKNPELSQKLGLISAKADLVKYAATDWPTYLQFFGQIIAAGGFFLFVLVVSWIFGREFADGTVKDLLAVPVQRSSIILAKFLAALIWSVGLSAVLFLFGLLMGAGLKLPDGSLAVLLRYSGVLILTCVLTVGSVLPFALFASIGRGYLLPLGMAVLTLMVTNIVALIGWGEYFPWAVAGLLAQGASRLPAASYWIVAGTCLVGILATNMWWKYADQAR